MAANSSFVAAKCKLAPAPLQDENAVAEASRTETRQVRFCDRFRFVLSVAHINVRWLGCVAMIVCQFVHSMLFSCSVSR